MHIWPVVLVAPTHPKGTDREWDTGSGEGRRVECKGEDGQRVRVRVGKGEREREGSEWLRGREGQRGRNPRVTRARREQGRGKQQRNSKAQLHRAHSPPRVPRSLAVFDRSSGSSSPLFRDHIARFYFLLFPLAGEINSRGFWKSQTDAGERCNGRMKNAADWLRIISHSSLAWGNVHPGW